MNLNNKTIIMTGGCGGIGQALIEQLLTKNTIIYAFDICLPEEKKEGVTYIHVDVTKSDEIKKALKQIPNKIDILINLAGVMRRGNLFEATEEEYDLLFKINVKASWLMVKLAKPFLQENATILQMSSRHGQTQKPDPAIYSLTKHAVYGLAELLQKTCPNYIVKIACPGSIDTQLSREGVEGEALEKKRKSMRSPKYMADLLLKLLESDEHTKILFDEKKWSEYLE